MQKSGEEAGGRLKGGGALYFENLESINITDCNFADNSALYGSGGGLFCSVCGDVLVSNSSFTNNSAADQVSKAAMSTGCAGLHNRPVYCWLTPSVCPVAVCSANDAGLECLHCQQLVPAVCG
jgi:hypothetical protein